MSEKAKINFSILKRLVVFAKPYKHLFFLVLFGIISLAVLGAIRPMLIGQMVNDYIIKFKDEGKLLIWTLIIFGSLFLEAGLQFLTAYFSNYFAQNIIKDIRMKIFKHMMQFKVRYFDSRPVGSLITRVVSDLEAITEVFSAGIIDISGDVLTLVFTLVMMFSTDWKLAILTIIPIPFLLIATRIFARAMRKSFQMEREQVNKLNSFVQERITGMSLVQLFNREKREYELFEEINKGHRQAHIKAVWANSIFFPIVEMFSSFTFAFILVWMALQVEGKTSAEIKAMFGQVVAFTFWINMLYRPIRMLADKFNILQRGMVRAERIVEILDHTEDIQSQGTGCEAPIHERIKFENVYFSYKDEDWVLKNLSFEILPGQTVAFVGATGAGKSTIVNLLTRFYDYQKGEIYMGDIALKNIDTNDLRKKIAIVLQDVFLFSDSIYNNVTLYDDTISMDKVVEAAKLVGAHDFIMQLPDNYDYKVGERGSVLSVGQRQLLSFMRAYVFNPDILILDEATSSVDNDSEVMIQKATQNITKGRTSIVIAHRLSTIQNADVIIVMDKGEIVEMGSPTELLSKDGFYKKLYDRQFIDVNEN